MLSSDNGLADIAKNFCHQVASRRAQSPCFVQRSCAHTEAKGLMSELINIYQQQVCAVGSSSRNQSELQRPHLKLNFLFLMLILCLLILQEAGHNALGAATSHHHCPKSRTGKEITQDFVDKKLILLRHLHQL